MTPTVTPIIEQRTDSQILANQSRTPCSQPPPERGALLEMDSILPQQRETISGIAKDAQARRSPA